MAGIKAKAIRRERQQMQETELKVPTPKDKSCKMGKEVVSGPFSHSVYARLCKEKLKHVEIRF